MQYMNIIQMQMENNTKLLNLISHCFHKNEKSATRISPKLLTFSVDQPGLEPGTSRL